MNKTGSKILHGMLLVTSALVGCNVIASTAAMAGPTGGSVVVGHATITNPSATQTVVNQSSKKALINWDSFSIPVDSTVKFNQPSSHSLTVNRVTGPNASAIDGQLLANGNVWLINANGIMFGRGSQVNVGALLATTSDLSDDDFRKDKYKFGAAQNPNAAVVNKGTITAGKNGSVVLSAPRVSNEGLIQADLGTVVLGGAKAFTVDMKGDNLLRYQITAPVTNAPKDANGSVAGALVSNSGNIVANGGKVLMTARAARNIEDNVINNTGMVEATSVSSHNGEIDLDAGSDGTVNAGGTLDASGAAKGQTGGTINVTAGTVNVADGAKLNASGYAGGGTIEIGGGSHGKGPLAHAQNTIIGKAKISADALNKGNGGSVTVWSDGDTSYAGSISAKGGKLGGNGGTVETSGHRVGVAISGTVNTTASKGKTGNWILDPQFIDIDSSGPDSVGCPNFDCNISASSIISALGTTNVMLQATGGGSADITIDAALNYASANTLSLLSTGTIHINAGIQNSSTGDINLISGWNGSESRLGHLTDSGVYGNNSSCGAIVFNNSASIGSAGGVTTVAGSELDINQSASLYAQIGYNGVGGGDVNVLTTGDLNLIPQCGSIVQIGNGHTTGSIGGNVTGDVSITIGGTGNLNATNGTVVIGNRATAGHSETGNVTLIAAGGFSDTGDNIGSTVSNDIVGGDVTIGAGIGNEASDLSFSTTSSSGLSFNSTHNLTLLSAGVLSIADSIQNSGNGSITLVGGWDGTTLARASLTNSGVYGRNEDGVEIGGFNADGDVSVGTKKGKTIVAGYDVGVDGMFGDLAQIGYSGAGGGGDIVVDATHNLYLTGGEGGAGVIGNGVVFGEVDGNVTGNISLNVAGTTTLTFSAGEGGPGDEGWVFIGNGAAEGFKESGNVTVITGDVSNEDSFNGEDTLGAMLLDDLGTTSVSGSGGNVVFATTVPQTDFINAQLGTGVMNYNSPHSLTLLSTHDITLPYSIQNSGNGALTILAGWNPTVAPSAVLTTPGAYGNNTQRTIFGGEGTQTSGADVWVVGNPNGSLADSNPGSSGGYTVGASGTGTAIGSKGGTTTIGAAQIYVEGLNGYAQIGYHASGGTGAINVIANGTPGAGGLHGIQACFDGDANICVIGGRNGSSHANPTYAQIGDLGMGVAGTASSNINISATGNVAVAGGGIYDDTQPDPMIANAYGMIGNGDASRSVNQTVGGNVSLKVAGQMNFASSDASNSIAWLGNRTGSGGVSSGALTLVMGSEDESGSMGLGDYIGYALGSASVPGSGGDVIVAATDTANSTIDIKDSNIFSSSHDLTLLTAGSAIFSASLENTGSGDITVVAGWNMSVPIANVLTTAGAYGNNGGSVRIGGTDATGSAALGSAGGKTTILTDFLDVDAVHGFAQLGYHGTGGGNIVVNAQDVISVTSEDAGQVAQIGNGGFGVSGAITGNIQLNGANLLITNTADNAVAEIGNIGGNNASESGNLTINTPGAVTIVASNSGTHAGIAHVGNYTAGTTNGTSTGNIAINAGALSLNASGNHTYAEIGTGTFHGGTDNGAVGGDITIIAGTLGMSAVNGDQARIGNLGYGTVTGNINIATAGGVAVTGDTAGVASIGSVSAPTDSDNNAVQGQGSGNLTVQAGGSITLAASNGGSARIESGGFTTGNVNVTAADNVSLLVTSTTAQNGGLAFIGGFTSGNGTINTTVTATNGYVSVSASDIDGVAEIGNVDSGAAGAIGGKVTVSAANTSGGEVIVSASGANSVAQIGNRGDAGLSGDVSIIAGNGANMTTAATGALALFGNIHSDGTAGSGSVTLTAPRLGLSSSGGQSEIAGGSADITLTGAGNGIGGSTAPLVVDVGALAVETNDGDVFLTSPGGLSIGVGSDRIDLASGSLTLTAGGDITQTRGIEADTVTLSTTSGDIVLTNQGNDFHVASLSTSNSDDASLYDALDLTISGATIGGDLTLTGGGSVGQSGAITANSLSVTTTNGAIALTNTGNAFDAASLSTSGSDDASLYDSSDLTISGATVGGDLTLSGGGSVGQSGAITATDLSVTTTNGAIALGDAGNAFDTASLSTSGGDDASLNDSANLTIAGATIGGDLTLTGGGSIGQTGAIGTKTLNVSTTGGDITLAKSANAFGALDLSASGNATVADSTDLTVSNVHVGGDLTFTSGADLTFVKSIQLQNGSIAVTASGDITVGGASAAGDVAIGSKTGTTTLTADNVKLSAINGYAQVGYHGGGSGAVNVAASGDVTLTGGHTAGDFAQIGDGGYKVSGSNSAAVTVAAGGDVTLAGGSGQEAYAQIGNGGAESNSNSNGYTDTGLITVSGNHVLLNAGTGDASYVQIGDGGYKSGQSLSGTATVGGNINVNAVNQVSVNGNGVDAYAQIGNGGGFINSNAANGSGGTISGDVSVVVTPTHATTGDLITETAGGGDNAYVQIGNGGVFENVPVSGASVSFTISGGVTLSDLKITGSNTGTDAYAQIGNGDAAKTGTGNVEGSVTLANGTTLTTVNGTAPGAGASFGNATGHGTATGTVPKGGGIDSGTSGSVASTIQNPNSTTKVNVTTVTVTPIVSTTTSGNGQAPQTEEQTPLEQLADGGDEGTQASDGVADSVGNSLSGGKKTYVTSKTLIPGVLKQYVTLTPRSTHGVPPADEDYSSWGNEAFWRW